MPPKAQDKKKGAQVDEIDMSDIASLPQVNVCLMQICYSKFKDTATRLKIEAHVNSHWPAERVKNLTRQEIIDYGKSKQIIEDGDGTKGLTQAEMLGMAAADKLFEVTVTLRGEKKLRLKKQQDELDAANPAGAPHKIETDPNMVDCVLNIIDFPRDKKEAWAFSKFGKTINCHFEIYEVQEPTDPMEIKEVKEVAGSKEEAEVEYLRKVRANIDELKYAKNHSAKNAPVRDINFIRVPYQDSEQVELKTDGEGEAATNIMKAEEFFMKSFLREYMEVYSQFNLYFKQFKSKVDIVQLMPERSVMEELHRLKQSISQFEKWKQDQEATINEIKGQILTDGQKELMSQDQIALFESQKQESLEAVTNELKVQIENDRLCKERIKELRVQARLSIDEHRQPNHFDKSIYEKDFIDCPQVKNSISSVLSAMVSQVQQENKAFHEKQELSQMETTDSIDDLFEDFKKNILIDNNLLSREQKKNAKEPEPQQVKATLAKHVEVYDTLDTSNEPLTLLPQGLLDKNKSHAQIIANREKESSINLQLPGKHRYMMPDHALKSKRLRDFENPQFYPFSTLPIEDVERTMQLKKIQKLIKEQKIDEGAIQRDRLGKYKVFERKYDQYMTCDIMSQVLGEAMRYGPDVSSQYYDRTDQLLLVLHHKINGSKRTSEQNDKPHGIKTWKAPVRVMPDFSQWIKAYSHALKQVSDFVPKDAFEAPIKYSFDQTVIPEQMIDIDYYLVQNVQQNVNQYFPDDNSILNTETIEICGKQLKQSQVFKDKLMFGIQDTPKKSLPLPQQYGLVSYQPVGDQIFWLNFNDFESKVVIETVQAQKNKQRVIEIKPPEPTPEEIAAKEEALKAAQEAAKKAGKKGQAAVVEIIEEKPPEPIFKEMDPNFLDSLFKEEDIGVNCTGPCVTLTMKNGLIVRHMHDESIIQIQEDSLDKTDKHQEMDRVFLNKGIVIRHFKNHDCQILYPNGEVANFDREQMIWVVTNQNGYRRQYKDGVYSELPRINCLCQTDSATGIMTKLREDNVVQIIYPKGITYVQHADGTQIYNSEEGAQIRVEKEGFAPVMWQITEQANDSEEFFETEDLKSLDGYMILTYLPDNCIVKSLKLFKSQNDKRVVTKHIYCRSDYSCFMVDSDGDFRVISVNARSAINDEDEKARIGNDSNYLKQIYKNKGEYTPSVFYGNISNENAQSHIIIRDYDKPFMYRINGNHTMNKIKNESWVKCNDWDNSHKELSQSDQFDPERDIEIIGLNKNPFLKYFIFPRIFILNPEGDGVELLSQEQVDQIIKYTMNRDDVLHTSRVEYVENTQLNSMQVMNKVSTLQENQICNLKMNKLKFPEYAMPYMIKQKTELENEKLKPMQDIYRITNITEYTSFEPLKQNSFQDDQNRFKEWKQQQLRYETEFGIIWVATKDGTLDLDEIADNEFYSKRITQKILKERALNKKTFDRNVFKRNFTDSYNTDEDVIKYRKKMTSVEKEETKQKEAEEKQKKMNADKKKQIEKQNKEKQMAVERLEKQHRTREKVNKRLLEYKQQKETKTFSSHFHLSRAGIHFYMQTVIQPPSEDLLMRMEQRLNRNKDVVQNQEQMGSASMLKPEDNPIVVLETEQQMHQKSMSKSKHLSVSQHEESMIRPPEASLFKQEQNYLKQLEQEKILKAEEHHVVKTKDFDVYGKLRTDKPFVKSVQKSNVPSDLNEKFITTECITDRRVKIASMANRQYVNAPSVEEVRKQGQHQMILQAINKKQTFSELINQANSMVTSVLHDSLKRCVNILPSHCSFGMIVQDTEAEMFVTIKNEDSLSQRIQIQPTIDKRIVVKQEVYGAIAPGMTKRLIVTIRATQTEDGAVKDGNKIKEEVHILTKSDIFKIPVEALIVTQAEFDNNLAKTGGSRVRTKLADSINFSKTGVMDNFRKMIAEQEQHNIQDKKKKKSDRGSDSQKSL